MKKISLTLLLVGLLFSQIILVLFNLNQGFEFHKVIFRIIPFVDYAGKASSQLQLSSCIIGYLFFFVFGLLNTSKEKYPQIFKSVVMYSAIALVLVFFELTSILEDIYGNFQGKHFYIGWLLFLLGMWIYAKRYIAQKK